MEKKKIGLKVADGSFYPILDEDSHGKKKLVLTTVNDNQDSVQIDLYRGTGESLEGATYVGSLMVEDIKQESKGTAEIELVLGVDEEGNLESVATDRASGAKQSLAVGLQDLGEESLYEVPDFSLTEEDVEETPEGDFADLSDEDIFGEDFEAPEEEKETELEEESLDLGDLEEESGDELEAELEAPGEEPVEGPEEAELPELEAGSAGEITESDFDIDFDSEEEDEFDFSALEEPEEDFAADLETEGEEELKAEPVSVAGDEFASDFGLDLDEDLDEELEAAEEPSREREWEEEKEPEEEEREPSRARPLLVAILVVLALALIGTLLYLFAFMSGDEEPVPGLEAQQGQEQTLAEGPSDESAGDAGGAGPGAESGAAEAEGQAGAPAKEQPTGAGAASGAGEAGIGTDWPSKDNLEYTGGVWYKIRWGDTLWEISSSFYDNPWMYGKIAEENEIRNPDRIFAEESIFIPKK